MIKVGVVGLGYWGPNLVRNFSKVKGCQVSIVCDLDPQQLIRIRKLLSGIKTTPDFNELTSSVDAVVIATPLKSHYPLAKYYLEKGKHVLVEKPFVASVKEAETLNQIAQKGKLTLMVDHTFEYSDSINKVRSLIRAGRLGRVYSINDIRVNLGLFQKDHNVIWDLAPHDISILLYVLEKEPLTVRAVGEDFIQPGIVDSAHIYLKFPDKIMASIYLSWLAPTKIRKMTIVGNKRMLEYDDLATQKIQLFDKGVELKKNQLPKMAYYETFSEFKFVYRNGVQLGVPIIEREPLLVMAQHFIDSIKKAAEPRTSGKKAMQVIKIITAAQKSLAGGGQEVKID